MTENNQESDKLLKEIFQNQKAAEFPNVPVFKKTFQAAQRLAQSNKRIKIMLIAATISILAIISFVVHDDIQAVNMDNITIAKGSMNLYERLMAEGKIVTRAIHFEYDQAKIKSTSMPILTSLAKMLKTHKKVHLRVEGHTDNTGDSIYNQQLSYARAFEVRSTLIKLGISPYRLTVAGLGESQPTGDNATEKGRALNRRVAFVLIKK